MPMNEYRNLQLSVPVSDPLFIIVVGPDGEPHAFAPEGSGPNFRETQTAGGSKTVELPNVEGAAWTVYQGGSIHGTARIGGTIYRWP
jgi:hypothetical protein